MSKRIITLCYRKIIDVNSTGLWERLVFNDTYTEFLTQVKKYNPEERYSNFAQLMQYNPEAAKLHFLVSSACTGYLNQLNEQMPDIYNILGQPFLTFKSFHFEIINSDIHNSSFHEVAINFYTDSLVWHEAIGHYLLLSDKNAGNYNLTNLVQLVPYLSIHSLKTLHI
ncbi:hypothetical protein [Pedobacter sp. L105]|uniref:hypothetical protein n=1 Tax=Pedobacter sp. L105 TaxID=1641871 RepID=UPI00131DD1BF|nr:hypothetical protein [Pedobacter sp. L105]